MPPPPDAELIEGLAAGDAGAYAVLYDRDGAALFRVAVAIAGSREEAEDAVQDVFVALVRAGERLRAVRDLKAYLFASLRRAAIRRAQQQRRGPLPPVPASYETPREETSDDAVRLERALASLPAAQRQIIALHVDGGLTFAECAAILGASANTAASRYRYAIEKLRAALKE